MGHNYKELKVWQKATEMVTSIYRNTELFPESEKFGLTQQIRRAAVSIPSNIAEGSGRNTPKDFAHFLAVAKGSAFEMETQLIIANNLGFIESSDMNLLLEQVSEVQKMLYGLHNKILNNKIEIKE